MTLVQNMHDASSNQKFENIDDLAPLSCPTAMCEPEVRRQELLDIQRDIEETQAILEELTRSISDSVEIDRGIDITESLRFLKKAKRQRRRRIQMVVGMVGLFLFPPALAVAILP